MTTERVKLGDTATFVNGYAFKPTDWSQSGKEIIRIQNLTKSSSEVNWFEGEIPNRYLVRRGDLLISWSATLGVYEWNGEDAWLNQHIFKVVFDKRDIDKRFFKYLVQSKLSEFERQVHGATMKHITKSKFDNVPVDLPPLSAQRQIADTLDKAEALRQKDQQLLQKYDELAQSIFYEMFGDPVRNERGWKVKTLGEVCKSFKYGTNIKSHDTNELGTVPVIRIPNVLNNMVVFENLKYSKLSEKEFKDVKLQKGDLVFVRTNGNPDYIGRCAVFNSDKNAAYASYLIRARLEEDSDVTPQFLQSVLSSKMYRREVVKRATTTAGNYNINTESLRSLKLIIPPIELQLRYLEAYNHVIELQATVVLNCSNSEQLFHSQLTRFFNN